MFLGGGSQPTENSSATHFWVPTHQLRTIVKLNCHTSLGMVLLTASVIFHMIKLQKLTFYCETDLA